jgi:hypothetical protein
MTFEHGHPSAAISASVVAVCRALLAEDVEALEALYADAEPVALSLAACWLVIGCHRSVLGPDPEAIDDALADMQRQWIDIQARHGSA